MRGSTDKPLPVTPSSLLHATPSTSIFSEVHDFQKGIKCDLTLYPMFKDDRQYDSWYDETHTIASVMEPKLFLTQTIALLKLPKLYYG